MSSENVVYKKTEILKTLRHLNQIVVSLDRIGSEYSNFENDEQYHAASSNFLDEWKVLPKLAEARGILHEAFSRKLGADDMDELEREFKDLQYWSASNPSPK